MMNEPPVYRRLGRCLNAPRLVSTELSDKYPCKVIGVFTYTYIRLIANYSLYIRFGDLKNL